MDWAIKPSYDFRYVISAASPTLRSANLVARLPRVILVSGGTRAPTISSSLLGNTTSTTIVWGSTAVFVAVTTPRTVRWMVSAATVPKGIIRAMSPTAKTRQNEDNFILIAWALPFVR